MNSWKFVEQAVEAATGKPFRVHDKRSISGGSINDAYVLIGDNVAYFVKLNSADRLYMFEAEMAGLQELAKAEAIRIPQAICSGTEQSVSFLVMEYIPFGRGGAKSDVELARQLAAMHEFSDTQYGWYQDNTIGSTKQSNEYCHDWITFFRDQRIGYQLLLAGRRGYGGRLQQQGEKLLSCLEAFIDSNKVKPSLLHGDLWSGNYAYDENDDPVIFDPAVYYGDREADLAMTELFGGFSRDFYAAYNEIYSLDDGYRVRKTLYNLYHILNHLNLFGSSYMHQAQNMMDSLLSEVR